MNTEAHSDVEADGVESASCGASESLASCAKNSIAKVEEFVQRDPKTAMLISVGAGLGLGVLVGVALAGSPRKRGRGGIDRQRAEQFGHTLMEAISKAVPASVSSYFGDR